ncbi:MAG: conjugal transfer protein TraX [Treponema sp.]|jgi:hypothetical protein|nr:conjugal transfer protein TraX [Treponema sp.]
MSDENLAKNPETGVEGVQKQHFPGLLSGGTIKIMGLLLMVMDHLYQMFINQGFPTWLKWFGRPVAPIFLFLCAEGFYYTRNKKLYVLRFFGAFILMSIGNRLLTGFLYVENIELINNIFGTLFMCSFYMLMIDLFRDGIREKRPGRILLATGGFLAPLAAGVAMVVLIFGNAAANPALMTLFFIIPSPFTVEGGLLLVAMGVLFYILRKYRRAQALVPAAAGLLVFFTTWKVDGIPNPQWFMVFAALPILLYNGKRGWGAKYFFYAFYPVHIYLFYLIAWLLRSR